VMRVILSVAAALIIFALGFVAGRGLRLRSAGLTSAAWAAIGCAGILLVGAGVLYGFLNHASAGRAAPVSAPAAADSEAGTPVIRVKVELAPALRTRVPDAAVLYVFVRDPAQGGPPLAVKRLPSQFPQTVELTPVDAMIAGHGFQTGQRVEVIARISPSGNPMDESGDLSGHSDYQVGRDGLIDLVIDHLTP
jgi:hypothetical protein